MDARDKSERTTSDYPQVGHPWAGDDDGHNCTTCERGSVWMCDRLAHAVADMEEGRKQSIPVLQKMQRVRRKALDESLHKGLA